MIKAKKGITLLELLIVMGIVAVLSVILFRTFLSISEIAFHVEQQKNVSNELISISQIMQNFADKNTIDYEAYSGLLTKDQGLTTILYLSGQDGNLKFYSSGDCIDMSDIPTTGLADRECAFYVNKNGEDIKLTNSKKIYLSNVMFKIIPFDSESNYTNSTGDQSIIQSLNKPGFWMLAQAYNTKYDNIKRANKIKIHSQQFFNLK